MIIDGELIKKSEHKYLKEALGLPDYYGENLDALYDCLCEMAGEIILINSNVVDGDIISTFVDANKENDFLTFKIEED